MPDIDEIKQDAFTQSDDASQMEQEQTAWDSDVMQQKIKEYREMLKHKKPDLDLELLYRILHMMNESSEVHVAIDPIAADGEWSSSAPTYAVMGVKDIGDGRHALRVSAEKHGITVGELERKLHKAYKRDRGTGKQVYYVYGETVTQLTDAYSHALVRQQWAGLPYDLVLAVKTKEEDAKAGSEAEKK